MISIKRSTKKVTNKAASEDKLAKSFFLFFLVEGRNDQFPVNCDKNELDKVLMQTVHATSGCSVQSLLDLYNQFSRIVKKFTNSYNRKDLPKVTSRSFNWNLN